MRYYKYYKVQFMTLTSILVVGILLMIYFNINKMIFIDLSQYIPEYVLLIKNIREKLLEIVRLSKNCEEFKYNIEEFSKILEKLRNFGYYISIDVRISPCQFPYNIQDFPTTSEIEIKFSDGKVLYSEVFTIGWKPN